MLPKKLNRSISWLLSASTFYKDSAGSQWIVLVLMFMGDSVLQIVLME